SRSVMQEFRTKELKPMTPTFRKSLVLLFVMLLASHAFTQSAKNKTAGANSKDTAQMAAPSGKPVLWRDPGAVERLDLVGGAAGRQGAPKPPFTFIEESLAGTNPKV